MNFTNTRNIIAAGVVTAVSVATISVAQAAVAPGSIRYDGANTPNAPEPSLNVFYDVNDSIVGNESDFVRVKKDGEANSQYRNTIDTTCTNGEVFKVWMYVHNGASVAGNDNGNGPSVAHDVAIRMALEQGEDTEFDINGHLTSSNAGNLNDGAVIKCGNEKFRLEYVAGSAFAYLDLPNTIVDLPDSIVSGGTPIGTNALDGNVWGCWDQRVWMGMDVKVVKVEEPPVEQSSYECKMLSAVVINAEKNEFKFEAKTDQTGDASVSPQASSIQIIKLANGQEQVIDQKEGLLIDSYTFPQGDAEYIVRANVAFTTPDGPKTVVCEHRIKTSVDKPPVVTPPTTVTTTTVPETVRTGAGSVIGIFAAVSASAGAVYNRILRRR